MSAELPTWWKILNLEDNLFEKSQYANPWQAGKFRLKDLGVLRKIAPGLYESTVQEVREDNSYLTQDGKNFKNTALGKKIGSIPLLDVGLHPELASDPKAQEKYWQEHPEYRAAKGRKA